MRDIVFGFPGLRQFHAGFPELFLNDWDANYPKLLDLLNNSELTGSEANPEISVWQPSGIRTEENLVNSVFLLFSLGKKTNNNAPKTPV